MKQSDRDIMTSIGSILWRVEQTPKRDPTVVTEREPHGSSLALAALMRVSVASLLQNFLLFVNRPQKKGLLTATLLPLTPTFALCR